MAIDRQRVTEVYAVGASGTRVGSGYLITDHLVLTARHVVDGARSIEARPLGSSWSAATVAWSDEPTDAALLDVEGRSPGAGVTPPRLGRIDGRAPLAQTAVGFPAAHVRVGGVGEGEQDFGHVPPLTSLE